MKNTYRYPKCNSEEIIRVSNMTVADGSENNMKTGLTIRQMFIS